MKYGLIGEKLGHSYSKIIHRMLGNSEYELREIAPNDLDKFMREKDFLGINVTIPYKQAVIPYLDEIDESAKNIGAVNTIVNRDGKLYGYNTDYYGMIELFHHAKVDPHGKKAVILGSGGTSKTAKAVLTTLGAKEILTVSRSGEGDTITYGELYEKHSNTEIIVNTTPIGMYPNIYGCPIDISNFSSLTGVIDAVYNPINTTLVQNARNVEASAEGGLYMLVGQAAVAYDRFFDKEQGSALIDSIYNKIKQDKESIVLIGMPASGKSTVGKILAERLGREFVDTDDLITERIGMTISDYFKQEGEEQFRMIEAEVVKELADKTSLVIATGGGAILKRENVENLRYNGRLFFIDRPLKKLVPTESRPLSADKASIEKRYNERYSIYCDLCDRRIDADCDANGVAERILENYI